MVSGALIQSDKKNVSAARALPANVFDQRQTDGNQDRQMAANAGAGLNDGRRRQRPELPVHDFIQIEPDVIDEYSMVSVARSSGDVGNEQDQRHDRNGCRECGEEPA